MRTGKSVIWRRSGALVLLALIVLTGVQCAPASEIPVYGPADRLGQFTVQQATATSPGYPVPTSTGNPYPGDPTPTPLPLPTTAVPSPSATLPPGITPSATPTATPKIPQPDTATPTPTSNAATPATATPKPDPTETPQPPNQTPGAPQPTPTATSPRVQVTTPPPAAAATDAPPAASATPASSATATLAPTAAASPSAAAPTTPPTAAPAPSATPQPQPTRPLNNVAHVVNAGETLSGLAAYYGVSLNDLARFNGLTPFSTLRVGQVLQVPLPAGVSAPPPPTPPALPTADAGTPPSTYPLGLTLDAGGALYFINDGSLLRLDPQRGTLTIVVAAETVVGGLGGAPQLPGNRLFGPGPLVNGSRVVTDFRLSDDGRTLLVERGLQTADGTQYQLALVDAAGNLTTLLASAPDLIDIELSADGRYATALRPESANTASVLAFDTTQPTQLVVLGNCVTIELEFGPATCRDLARDKDDSGVLFVDGAGVWRAPYSGRRPTLLFGIDDLAVEIAPTTFGPIAWSPSGRYLLTWGYYFEGSQRFVYDDETDRIAPVPYSDAYVFVSSVSWLPEDRLMVLEPSDPAAQRRPVLTILNPDPDADPWLVEDARFAIPTVPEYGPAVGDFPGTQMYAPDSYSGAGGVFAIVSADAAERGLYRVDLDALTVQQIDGWPELAGSHFVQGTAWAPNDAGLITTLQHTDGTRRAFWLSASSGDIIELDLNGQPCCFEWR